MNVLVSDLISPNGIDILKKAGLNVDVKPGLRHDELKAIIGNYDALVIRSATKVTAEIIQAAANLKVIGRAGSGLDNVDRTTASKKGIVVMNTPGGNTITTAEHTLAMMFAVARKIPQANASMSSGKWEKKKFMGIELFNKTLGIVGLGKIGTEVARRAHGLGMRVLAFDPFLSEERAKGMGIEKTDFPSLIRKSDFITLHTPLTTDTKNIINAETIAAMKDGVIILNCARGGLVNEKALYNAIESGKVAGAALDVFEKEPPENNPLIGHDKVVSTPHLGASTHDAQDNVAVAIAEQIVDYLVNDTIRNAVNFPSIPSDQVKVLQPYISLAEKIGSFTSQIFEGGMTGVTLEYRGEMACLYTAPLTIAAIKGLLTPMLEEEVNFVNAPCIARERGINIRESKSADAGDYLSLVAISVESSTRKLTITGTLLSKREPRIIRIDDFSVEIIPEGNMLFITNIDKPGVIGSIGTLLGSNNINIARMHFGRETAGGRAISVFNIDTPVSDEMLQQIISLPNILNVKVINL